MARCAFCRAVTNKICGRTFHKFPLKKPVLLKKWLENLPIRGFKPNKDSILCSNHFTNDSLDKTGFRVRLKFDSIPTIFNDYYGSCVSCNRKQHGNNKHSFVRFPFDKPELLTKWVKNINISDYFPDKEDILCIQHFEKSCLKVQGKYSYLKARSVPTLFNNFDNHFKIQEDILNIKEEHKDLNCDETLEIPEMDIDENFLQTFDREFNNLDDFDGNLKNFQ